MIKTYKCWNGSENLSKQTSNLLLYLVFFSKYDLYSKADDIPDPEKIKPYYQSLIDKYIPGVLNW